MKAKLDINGVSVLLSFMELEFIADILPDCEDNALVFHELAKSKSSEVRIAVANKRYLLSKTVKLLLQDSSIMVLCQVLRTDIGVSCLTTETLTRFIELGSVRLMKAIIIEFDEIVNEFNICPIEWIVDLIIQHQDPLIRYELAEMDIPLCYLKILAEDQEISVAMKAQRQLEELEL